MATTGVNPDGSIRSRLDQLPRVATTAGWPTTTAQDAASSRNATAKRSPGAKPANIGWTLLDAATMAGWPTPVVGNAEGGQTMTNCSSSGRRPDGSKATVSLGGVAQTAGWPTPMAGTPAQNGNNEAGNTDSSRKTAALCGALAGHGLTLPPEWSGPARLTARGEMLTGSSAGMESGGRLNPRFSGWLMGFPEEWCRAAIRSHKTRKRGSRASAATATPSFPN
jgi:hypothetical protein